MQMTSKNHHYTVAVGRVRTETRWGPRVPAFLGTGRYAPLSPANLSPRFGPLHLHDKRCKDNTSSLYVLLHIAVSVTGVL
jgi:hypothetical protein